MAEFTWVESAGTALEEQPRIGRTQFGDGYVQDAPDGLNPIPQAWSIALRDVQDSVADQVIAFFRARVTSTGFEAFDWTPRWSTTAIRVKCSRWKRSLGQVWGESDIDATFEQVFGQ